MKITQKMLNEASDLARVTYRAAQYAYDLTGDSLDYREAYARAESARIAYQNLAAQA